MGAVKILFVSIDMKIYTASATPSLDGVPWTRKIMSPLQKRTPLSIIPLDNTEAKQNRSLRDTPALKT